MRYTYTFDFFDTIEQAENEKKRILKSMNRYYNRVYKNKFSILPWTSSDGSEHKIIMGYYR